MSRVPARNLISDWAINPDRKGCFWCMQNTSSVDLVLHHDHLLDFALEEFRRLAGVSSTSTDVDALWASNVVRFRALMRFAPVWVCRKHNEGDGWAKAPNWCGRAAEVYPRSFSMTLPELDLMRAQGRGMPRRRMAETIWRSAETEHSERQRAITVVVEAILSDAPAMPQCQGNVTDHGEDGLGQR